MTSKSRGLDQCGLSLMIKTETSKSCETETRPRVLPMSTVQATEPHLLETYTPEVTQAGADKCHNAWGSLLSI